MSKELWKPVLGYEGLYEVSNKGRVKSLIRSIYDINTKKVIDRKRTKILKTNVCGTGRVTVRLAKNGEQKTIYVHRLVATAFLPNPNGFAVVNHLDSNPLNNCVENLEWCTQTHNMQYAADQVRLSNKLTPCEVVDIRTRHKNGESNKSIYEDYPQVIPKTIRNVINNKTWRRICKVQ